MIGIPYIPKKITVHLGRPDANARNITIDFPEYIKNAVSSEIYPTWNESAIRANVYAITTFALNRVYTEWYRSRGYDFDITNSVQYDQSFNLNGSIFENISVIVDELFNDYVTRQGTVEPYFTAFCDGKNVECRGLSQWGSESLARKGYIPYEILKYYYGKNIRIVFNAPVRTNTPSYPGTTLSEGNISEDVKVFQLQLNRISRNYPRIPRIPEPNGFFGPETTAAVKEFQRIFNIPVTGKVNSATWYRIAYIFTSVKKLAEFDSEGIALSEVPKQHEYDISRGEQSDLVRSLQYYLAVIGAYYASVIPVPITGYFGTQTESSVKSFQKVFGLPQTGVVDLRTWNDLYRAYAGIVESVPINPNYVTLYPGNVLREGMTSEYVKILQEYLTRINRSFPDIPAVSNTGYFGPMTKASVMAFQKKYGLKANGAVGAETWSEIAKLYSDLRFGEQKQQYQYPGYIIK